MPELHATLVYPGCHPRGGVERVVWETVRHLAPRHRVSVVGADVEADGAGAVEVHRRARPGPPAALAPARWRRAARRALAGVDPGVVVSYGADCPPGDVLVVQSVHRAWLEAGRPVPVRGVAVPPAVRWAMPRHRVLLALERSYFREGRGRRVVAVSANVADDLARFYGVDPALVEVVPNGYSAAQCSPGRAAARRDEMRAALGLGPDDVALLLVANEWHRKGLGVLLEAMALLGGEPVHLVLVGRMAPDAFAGRIERLGLAGRVHYRGPAADVSRYHAAADLFVMPTQYEAFGSVIVEALASGVPVITTARAGAAAAVSPGRNGLLQQDPDDPGELAGLLRRGLDPATRAAWREAAPGYVRDYEWSSVMARMEAVIAGAAR